MRNLARIQDVIHSLEIDAPNDRLVSLSCNHSLGKLYVLSVLGRVFCFETHDGLAWKYTTKLFFEDMQETWFSIEYVAVTNTVVCLSREGSLVAIEEDSITGLPCEPEQIGVIEGGIAAASWHPDHSSLCMLTQTNNTVISMSNAFDVLNEVPYPPHNTQFSCELTWKGDGEMLAIVSTDIEDNLTKVRMLNVQLEVVSTSRQVGDGPAAVLKHLDNIASFATNGSYIATITRKAQGNGQQQVTFLEKNGLRHGDFDLLFPPIPTSVNNNNNVLVILIGK